MEETPPALTVHITGTGHAGAVCSGLGALLPGIAITPVSFAVDLNDGDGAVVNAQPDGLGQTSLQAALRLKKMRRLYGSAPLNIAVEGGAVDRRDVALVLLQTGDGARSAVVLSPGVDFPVLRDAAGAPLHTLEIARSEGFRTTTVAAVIHTLRPGIPADDWQTRFPPGISRAEQISGAISGSAGMARSVIDAALVLAGIGGAISRPPAAPGGCAL